MLVSPETAVAAAGLAVCGAAVATVAGLDGAAVPIAGGAAAVLLAYPATILLRTWLLDVHLDRGEVARAIAVAERARSAAVGGRSRARAAVDLALAHLAAGDATAAAPLLADAARVLPPEDLPDTLALLAIALAHDGDRGQPLVLAREAAGAATGDRLHAYALGLALLAAGDPASALPHLSRGAEGDDADLVPSPGERAYALGRAHAALGQDAAARAAFERAAAIRPAGPFTRAAAGLLSSRPRQVG